MKRKLLNCEVAILLEAGASSMRNIKESQQVWQEFHAPPHVKRRQWFNTDFVIELNNWDEREQAKASGVSIRPWSLAGTYFVMITPTGVPTKLELLEGESLPKSSFRDEIHLVENVMRSLRELPCDVSPANAPFFRVARLEKSVVFWLASTTHISELLNAQEVPVSAGENNVSYRAAKGHILVDGVLV